MLLPETEEEAQRIATVWLSQIQQLRSEITDIQRHLSDEIAQKQRRVSGLRKMLDGLGTLWPSVVPEILVKEEQV